MRFISRLRRSRSNAEQPEWILAEHVMPTRVTAGQVRIARFRVARDQAQGRITPEPYVRIAAVRIAEDELEA